ncbi:citrate lyase subunit alpha [Treponema pedis]|uniref:citrate lyase subunit alpha n=1 Tax=Treponema pedis TaxID=409322 RepID=UPI0004166784|nr:citrate lyase subunit alpha [Treponema pedis]
MKEKRVDKKLLSSIKGYENRQAYVSPFAFQPEGTMEEGKTLKDCVRRCKVVETIEEAVKKTGLKNGMTISFHHHFRDGDKVLPMVMNVLAKMGFKDLRVAASSFTAAHECMVEHIENGVVNRIESSGVRGKLAEAVSNGILASPAVIRSHGGRARAIVEGDLKIDVAFLGVPSSDCMGNANGVVGKSVCGSLGYAMVDARYAEKVILITDCLVDYPNNPISIPQTDVDFVVKVDEIGDSEGIMSGATRFTKNPKEILIAKNAVKAMTASGYFTDGFSMQTGSGGAALAVTRFIKEEMLKRNIKCSYALGGITAAFAELLEEGLVKEIFDVQDFDLGGVESLTKNPGHKEISADFYASPFNKSAAVNKLDFVVLSALEIDRDFNVNVISGSNGVIRAASGGHSDAAACAKMSIIVAPLLRGRLPIVIDRVTTIVTPGETVDVLVTELGITVNPLREDLKTNFKKAGIELIEMDELIERAKFLTGESEVIEFSDEVVAVVEYRDGSVIDVIKKVKQ